MSVSSGSGKNHEKQDSVSEGDDEIPLSVSEEGDSMEQGLEIQKKAPVLPQYQYTRTGFTGYELLPLSKKRPEFINPAFLNNRGIWDPDRWHEERKRSETPPEAERGRGDITMDHKRRSGDPRERIRKEQDGIVLSPQRRSFNSGCSVTLSQNNRRAESPLGKIDRE
ncbi:hypothetical protein L9F63_018932, partial [Diploptera punctata]